MTAMPRAYRTPPRPPAAPPAASPGGPPGASPVTPPASPPASPPGASPVTPPAADPVTPPAAEPPRMAGVAPSHPPFLDVRERGGGGAVRAWWRRGRTGADRDRPPRLASRALKNPGAGPGRRSSVGGTRERRCIEERRTFGRRR